MRAITLKSAAILSRLNGSNAGSGANIPSAKAPRGLKIVYTLFVTCLAAVYIPTYGPANFLWICDIALLLTVWGIWTESPFLLSMQLIACFLVSIIWLLDLLTRSATGRFLTGMTTYMFNPDVPLLNRGLSLYHAVLPFLLLWLVGRVGYDSRGWRAQSLLTWVLLPTCYLFTSPSRNINAVFGWAPSGGGLPFPTVFWVIALMVIYPLLVYWPTHLLLSRLLPSRHEAANLRVDS